MAHEFSEEYAPLLNASFQGYVNLGGFSFKNIDASRDGCELHLHRFSGMIMVKRDGCTYLIGSSAVHMAEMAEPDVAEQPDAPNQAELELMAFAEEVKAEPYARPLEPHPDLAQIRSDDGPDEGPDHLADAILAELGHSAPNLGETVAIRRQKRAKRSE